MAEDVSANTSAEVTMPFGDGAYTFALKIRQIEELQRKCEAGLGTIIRRVCELDYHARDIYDTIRLGLIGGGTPDVRALELVNTYVDGQPYMVGGLAGRDKRNSPYTVARAILMATQVGLSEVAEADEEVVKKKTTVKKRTRKQAGSIAPASTAKP